MTSPRVSARDLIVLEHASEEELLGLLKYKRIDPVAQARATAHIDRCTICNLRLEQRQEDIAKGTLPIEHWESTEPALQRFVAPLRLLVSKLGALLEQFGPPALPGDYVAGTLTADRRQERKRWSFKDEDHGVVVHMELQGVRGPSDAAAELTARFEKAGAPVTDARIEIKGTIKSGRAFVVSDRFPDIERQPVRLPEGQFSMRITVPGDPAMTWEIPFETEREE